MNRYWVKYELGQNIHKTCILKSAAAAKALPAPHTNNTGKFADLMKQF